MRQLVELMVLPRVSSSLFATCQPCIKFVQKNRRTGAVVAVIIAVTYGVLLSAVPST